MRSVAVLICTCLANVLLLPRISYVYMYTRIDIHICGFYLFLFVYVKLIVHIRLTERCFLEDLDPEPFLNGRIARSS